MGLSSSDLIEKVTQQYLSSGDFNGFPIHQIQNVSNISGIVSELIANESIDVVRGDGHPNPHIKALDEEPINLQLEKIKSQGLGDGCLYPTKKHLESISAAGTELRPFTRQLMLERFSA